MSLLYLTLFKILAVLLGLGVIYCVLVKIGMRKFFPIPLILCLGLSTYLLNPPAPEAPNTLTPEQKTSIRQEEMHIAAWYNDYQKDVEQMDITWQQYHKILSAFRNDEISIQTVYMRLFELQKKTNDYKTKYEHLKPPAVISKENDELLSRIIDKTYTYANQQDSVLTNSLNQIMPKNLKTTVYQEQLQILDKIMILESPTTLDISQELTKIKDNLVIPGEK